MTFELGGVRVKAGERGLFRLPVCTMAHGHPLTVDVHILCGNRPGPVVGIVAGTHGEEVFSTELCRQAWLRLEPEDLAGAVLILPQGNPPSFEWGTRHTLNDGLNLNRVFPGNRDGWLTERVAHAIATQILPRLDLLIDYHGGAGDTEICYTYTKPLTSEYNRRVHDLAVLCEAEVLYEREVANPGSISDYAASIGLLAVVPEVGGGPSLQNPAVMEQGLRGLWNLLKYVGTLRGEPEVVVKPRCVVRRAALLRPAHGGLFLPSVGSEVLGKRVPAGTVLGRVVSPYTFEELDVIRAPFTLDLMMVRSRVSRVHPGDYAYIAGDPASGYDL